jgi:hypothetical protein
LHRPGSLHALSNCGDGDADDTTTLGIDDGGDGNFGDDGDGNFGDDGDGNFGDDGDGNSGDDGDGNSGDDGDGNCGGDDGDRKRVSSWGSYSIQTDEPLQQLPRLRRAVGPLH